MPCTAIVVQVVIPNEARPKEHHIWRRRDHTAMVPWAAESPLRLLTRQWMSTGFRLTSVQIKRPWLSVNLIANHSGSVHVVSILGPKLISAT